MLRAMNWGGGGGGGFLLGLPVRALLALALAAFLFGWSLGGRLVALGGYHHSLRGGPDVIFQCGEFIGTLVQFLHSCRWVQGQRLEERGSRPKASSEVLQDRIHTVYIDLLDCLTEPACEVPDGLVFLFEDGLKGADVPFLPNRA